MTRQILLIYCLLGFSCVATAQQLPLYAQHAEFHGLINPASLNIDYLTDGRNISIGTSFRQQWVQLGNLSPSTQVLRGEYVSPDDQSPFVFGGYIIHDKVGITNNLGFYGRAAYVIKTAGSSLEDGGISIGLNLGIASWRLHTEQVSLNQPDDPNVVNKPASWYFLELQRRFPQTRFAALADDADAIRAIDATARAAGAVIELLLDVNPGMNRTGIAPGPAALDLYRLLASLKNVRAGGLQFYDGHHQHPDRAERRAAWEAALAPAWQLRDSIQEAGLPIPRIVAGGTPTLPFFAELPGIECSPGTTVLWDFGQPRNNPDLDFLNAAVLLTRVVSKPAANRLCLDLGHKAVASEMPHPRVQLFGLEDAAFVTHSEEHLVIETPRATEFAVGQVLYGLPRHVCPTVALHNEVFVVRDGRAGETWPVTARARKITI